MKTIRQFFLLTLAAGAMVSPWLGAIAGEHRSNSMAVGDVIPTTLDVKVVYDETDQTTWLPMAAVARVAGFPDCRALLTFLYDPVNRNFSGEAESVSCPVVGGRVDMTLKAIVTHGGLALIRPDGEERAVDLSGSAPVVPRNGGMHTLRATLNAGDEVDLVVSKVSPVPVGLPKVWKSAGITPPLDQNEALRALSPVAYETFRQLEKRHHLVYSANQLELVSQSAEFKAEYVKQMVSFCATTSGAKTLACRNEKG